MELKKASTKATIAQRLIDELKGQNRKLTEAENKKDYEEKIKSLEMKLQSEKVRNTSNRCPLIRRSVSHEINEDVSAKAACY